MLPRILCHRSMAPLLAASLGACASAVQPAAATATDAATGATGIKPWFVRDGFVAPEAVRYDPDQDVYFVGNWGRGPASDTDNNGFIRLM